MLKRSLVQLATMSNNMPVIRINQRMRMEASQLESKALLWFCSDDIAAEIVVVTIFLFFSILTSTTSASVERVGDCSYE